MTIPNVSNPPHSWWQKITASDYVQKATETYATQVVVLGLQMVITIIIARALGPSGRGFYAVAVAVGALGVRFTTFGLHASNTYYVAKTPGLLPAMLGNTLGYGAVGGSVAAAMLLLVFHLFPESAPLHGTMQVLAVLWIPLGLIYLLLQNLLIGAGDVRTYNVVELAAKICVLALTISIIVLHAISPESVFAAGLIALAISVLYALSRLWVLSGKQFRCSLPLARLAMSVGFRAYLISFFGFLVLRLDLLMVQKMLGSYDSGNYSVASAMADYVLVLPTVFGTILFPKVSAIDNVAHRLHITWRASLGVATLLLPSAVVASCFARPVVHIMFGAAFTPAAPAFVWLMPGIVFLGIESVAVQFLNSFGYPWSVIAIWIVSAALNVGLNLWAIPAYGINGAAAVSSVTYITTSVFILAVILRNWKSSKSVAYAGV